MEGGGEGLWKVEGRDCGRRRGGILDGRGEGLWKVEGWDCGR